MFMVTLKAFNATSKFTPNTIMTNKMIRWRDNMINERTPAQCYFFLSLLPYKNEMMRNVVETL